MDTTEKPSDGMAHQVYLGPMRLWDGTFDGDSRGQGYYYSFWERDNTYWLFMYDFQYKEVTVTQTNRAPLTSYDAYEVSKAKDKRYVIKQFHFPVEQGHKEVLDMLSESPWALVAMEMVL